MSMPKNQREWYALVWKFCNRCNGAERNRKNRCTDKSCPFIDIYDLPRQQVVVFDRRENVRMAVELAMVYYVPFTVTDLRDLYRTKYGNGDGLVACGFWGWLTQTKEWLAVFREVGETVSTNKRSHSDKVKLWQRK